jgi:hypothetical protein
MARVTATEVKTLIETDLADGAIANQILMANAMTNRVLAAGLTDADTLKLIEMNLAAHFIATTVDPRTKSEGVSGISQTNEGNFQKSRYWDNALTLDTTGTLKGAEQGRAAQAMLEVI